MELFKASRQWAVRPEDERFSSLEEMHAACAGYRGQAAEARVRYADLRVEPDGSEVALVGGAGLTAKLTHWAFGQLAARAGAPASYLRDLPATLAASCMNHGLAERAHNGDMAKLMFHRNGSLILRATTGVDYSRIWNSDITESLLALPGDGWRVPPARPARSGQRGTRVATAADVLRAGGFGLSINIGDEIAPAGLYASDHDMFAFMVNESRQIAGPDGTPLSRGVFVWNSEVGGGSFGAMTFYYRHVCGNHIVWGASGVEEVRLRHVGQAVPKAFRVLRVELRKYADSSASDEQATLARSATVEIAATKDDVIDAIFRRRIAGLTRARIGEAYDEAESRYPVDGNPRTAWGLAQGVTRLSQKSAYADERVELDKAAGKVLQIKF
jgi:hypothetical protein